MDIIITQWALDSYLELVTRKKIVSKDEYTREIRPDVLRLKNIETDTKFANGKFWSIAEEAGKVIPNGYKMKWHQVGSGKMQLRLPIGHLFHKGFYLCAAYIKSDPKKEKREMAKFKVYMQKLSQDEYNECGRL